MWGRVLVGDMAAVFIKMVVVFIGVAAFIIHVAAVFIEVDWGMVVGVVVPFGDEWTFGFVGLRLFESATKFGLAFGVDVRLVAFLGGDLYEIGKLHVFLEA